MPEKMPVGMVFVPSQGGVSHNKNEFTDWADVSLGLAVFSDTLRRINEKGAL